MARRKKIKTQESIAVVHAHAAAVDIEQGCTSRLSLLTATRRP